MRQRQKTAVAVDDSPEMKACNDDEPTSERERVCTVVVKCGNSFDGSLEMKACGDNKLTSEMGGVQRWREAIVVVDDSPKMKACKGGGWRLWVWS